MRTDAPYYFEDVFIPPEYLQGPYAIALKQRTESSLQNWEKRLHEYEGRDWQTTDIGILKEFITDFMIHYPMAQSQDEKIRKTASKVFLSDPIAFVECYKELAKESLIKKDAFEALSICYTVRLCCSKFPFSSYYIPKPCIESHEKVLFERLQS